MSNSRPSPSFQLTAPTEHFARVVPVVESDYEYTWTIHAPDESILSVGIRGTLPQAQTRARRDLAYVAYFPAQAPEAMRRAKWLKMPTADAQEDSQKLDIARLRQRFIAVLAQQLTDLARGEIEHTYAPIVLTDGRVGVRTLEWQEGRVRPQKFRVLEIHEFAALVETMEQDGGVNGAVVV